MSKNLAADQVHHIKMGFKWLGLTSNQPITPCGTMLDTLCALLESKMNYEEGERDMIMLQHTFRVQLADGRVQTRLSTLLEFGDGKKGTLRAL